MAEKHFSNEFAQLKEPVSIINEASRRKWRRTATYEKIDFFKGCDAKTALITFPNLANPAGYTLVRFIASLFIFHHAYMHRSYFMYIIVFVDSRTFLLIF